MAEQNQIDDRSVHAVGHKAIQDVHSLAWTKAIRVSVNKIGGKSLAPHNASGEQAAPAARSASEEGQGTDDP